MLQGNVPQASAIQSPATRYVCVPSLMWRNPELCPSHGPGATAYRISSISLPDPLPELPVTEIEHDEEEELVPHTFALVRNPPLNVYRHPMEAAAGLPPVRTLLSGDWWVSIDGEVEYEGQLWYQINRDEFDRVAVQSAKQKYRQTSREIHKDTLFSEFKDKVGEMIIGYYQRERNGNIFVDLGRTEGILPKRYQSPREVYRQGDRIKALIYEVNPFCIPQQRQKDAHLYKDYVTTDTYADSDIMETRGFVHKNIQILNTHATASLQWRILASHNASDWQIVYYPPAQLAPSANSHTVITAPWNFLKVQTKSSSPGNPSEVDVIITMLR